MTVDITKELQVKKSGDFPVYFTANQKQWNPNPTRKSGDFVIKTYFPDHTTTLKKGEEVTLWVDVQVKKDADYVMINVPIPAGCSYSSKNKSSYRETYRESFKNETAIFSQKLPEGKYTFTIQLLPRFSGKYTLNPAKVELMYFPTFNANTDLKKVRIN